jgi:RNA polymerase primary sigma factor
MKLKLSSLPRPNRRNQPVRVPMVTTRNPVRRLVPAQLGSRRPPAPRPAEVPRDPDVRSAAFDLPLDRAELVTPLARYLRDAIEVPLLTLVEETELAGRIQRGDDAAREHMIRANLRLVVKIARDYEGYGLPLLDLINEGNVGLMKAVERFDPAKGGKLSTYAAWWIKQSIRRALTNQSKTIRVPAHTLEKIWAMRRVADRYEKELGRAPTTDELAAETGLRPRRVVEIQSAALPPASLDAPLGDSDTSRLADVVPDAQNADPAAELARRDLHALVHELVPRLPERERVILQQRFGLGEAGQLTLRAIGRRFGVTRERIRQLQNLALLKLRKLIEEREGFSPALAGGAGPGLGLAGV